MTDLLGNEKKSEVFERSWGALLKQVENLRDSLLAPSSFYGMTRV